MVESAASGPAAVKPAVPRPPEIRPRLTVRRAGPEDLPVIHRLILELALYEGLEDRFTCRIDDLEKELFGTGLVGAALAETGTDGPAGREGFAGFALWYYTFSTFRGRRGVYLEDLFVLPEYRGKGYGKSLFDWVAAMAHDSSASRLDWAVLGWNERAKGFYRSLGAHTVPDWESWRLELGEQGGV